MKKLYICLLALCLLVLVFFTVFGETLYAYGKPVVSTAVVSTSSEDEMLQIPAEALCEDHTGTYVYVLLSEKGYSRTIDTVKRQAVTVVGREDGGYVKLEPSGALRRGDLVVTGADVQLTDGVRVLIER